MEQLLEKCDFLTDILYSVLTFLAKPDAVIAVCEFEKF